MSPLEHHLAEIHRRVLRRRLLLGVSRGALIGLAPAAVLLAIHPFSPLPMLWPMVVGLPALGLAAGLSWYAWARPQPRTTVRELDRRLASFDRYSTALECVTRGPGNAIEEELVRTTEKAAERLRPGVLVPSGWPLEARLALLLLLFVGAGIAILLPRSDALRLAARGVELMREARKVQDVLHQALDKSEVDPELARRLQDLMKEVDGAQSLEELLGVARRALSEVEAAAIRSGDPAAIQAARNFERVAEYLTRSATARELATALAQGDLARASRLGEELAREIRQTGIDPAEAARLAQGFRNSANVTRDASGQPMSNPSDLASPPQAGCPTHGNDTGQCSPGKG